MSRMPLEATIASRFGLSPMTIPSERRGRLLGLADEKEGHLALPVAAHDLVPRLPLEGLHVRHRAGVRGEHLDHLTHLDRLHGLGELDDWHRTEQPLAVQRLNDLRCGGHLHRPFLSPVDTPRGRLHGYHDPTGLARRSAILPGVSDASLPLTGLVVLDFTRVLAGP